MAWRIDFTRNADKAMRKLDKGVAARVFDELIGFMDIDGVWCVFHAMMPPTKKFKRELGWR